MAKIEDAFGMSKKKVAKAKKAIAKISSESAERALRQYFYFVNVKEHQGKRPNLHADNGTIIAPVIPAFVGPLYERLKTAVVIRPCWKRQTLRRKRCVQHEFNRRANEANEAHEKEVAKRPPQVAPEHRFEVVPAGIIGKGVTSPEPIAPLIEEEDDGSVDFVRFAMDSFGNVEVLVKKFRNDRTVVAVFWDGRAHPKKREVVEYTPGNEPKLQKAGNGNRQLVAKLEEAGWKWGTLKEYPTVVEFIAKETFSTAGKKAA